MKNETDKTGEEHSTLKEDAQIVQLMFRQYPRFIGKQIRFLKLVYYSFVYFKKTLISEIDYAT